MPFVETFKYASEVALPRTVMARLLPLAAVGRAIVCTRVPAGVYSSRKTGTVLADRAAVPSPTRTSTRLPTEKGDWARPAGASAVARASERMDVLMFMVEGSRRAVPIERLPPSRRSCGCGEGRVNPLRSCARGCDEGRTARAEPRPASAHSARVDGWVSRSGLSPCRPSCHRTRPRRWLGQSDNKSRCSPGWNRTAAAALRTRSLPAPHDSLCAGGRA